MCPHDVDTHAELAKLPSLIKEKGWSCSDIRDHYANTEPGCWLAGSSGPTEGDDIKVMTGTLFQVIAREDDLKVRVGWPGQFTTTYTCFSATQVMWWLEKILDLADREIAETKRSRNLL